ncbi:MAG: lambda exonuclease family protein [Pseudomonadota bacterium]
MKIIQCEQGSVEWLEKRAGIPTASEFGSLVTPTGEIRKGEMPKTYLAQKLAEKWGGPLPGFNSFATEQGQILEAEARNNLAFVMGRPIQKVGFITTDDGSAGCSPDGMISGIGPRPDAGLELKCPEATQAVKYLLAGVVPQDYTAQVQGSLYVTGLQKWYFVSYRRHYPDLIVQVEPDEEFQANLAEALEAFNEHLALAWERLVELNQGPPPRRIPMTFSDEIRRGAEYADLGEGVTP